VVFLGDEALHLHPLGFDIFGIDAVIAHEGVSHGNDLALVGGISENFLISGHGGVEDHLAGALAGSGKRPAPEDQAVFQCQKRFQIADLEMVGIVINITYPTDALKPKVD
jgi:hypothetical protein